MAPDNLKNEDTARLRSLSDEDLAEQVDLRWEAFCDATPLQLQLAKAAVDRAEAEVARRRSDQPEPQDDCPGCADPGLEPHDASCPLAEDDEQHQEGCDCPVCDARVNPVIHRYVVQARLNRYHAWSDDLGGGFSSDPDEADRMAERRLAALAALDGLQPSTVEVRVEHRAL